MKKNMEANPFNEDREEDVRVNEGDISKKKKNTKGFDELENIADHEVTLPFGEHIEISEENEPLSALEIEEKEEARIRELEESLFVREGDGVVSVGPDVEGKNLDEFEVQSDIKEEQTRKNLDSMNPQYTVKSDHEIRKENRNTGEEKDNLKTFKKKKDEEGNNPWEKRKKRGFWRDLFHFGPKKDKEAHFEAVLADTEHEEENNEALQRTMAQEFESNEHDKAA